MKCPESLSLEVFCEKRMEQAVSPSVSSNQQLLFLQSREETRSTLESLELTGGYHIEIFPGYLDHKFPLGGRSRLELVREDGSSKQLFYAGPQPVVFLDVDGAHGPCQSKHLVHD